MAACTASPILCFLAWIQPIIVNQQMLSDILSPSQLLSEKSFDFIIVGGGSAGCVVASRLSEEPNWRVLLLEAGGEEYKSADVPGLLSYNLFTNLDWQYKTKPDENYCGGKSCIWNSGKVLGGSSVVNGMIYNRGNALSYDAWKELGNEGWGFDDVLPYFKKSENNADQDIAANTMYHSKGGPLNVQRFAYKDKNVQPLVDALEELGYHQVDINGGNQTGVTIAQFTQKNGSRLSSNKAFLAPVRKRKNLTVVTNARVVRIVIDPITKRATGVEYVWEKFKHMGKHTIRAEKEVILSAGAFKSPQLLMLSGIGPRSVLTEKGIGVIEDLQVGQNLQNHPASIGILLKLGEKQTSLSNDLDIQREFSEYMRNNDGSLSQVGPLQVSFYIKSRYADPKIDYPDIQFFLPAIYKTTEGPYEFKWPTTQYNHIMFQPGVMMQKSRGYVTITDSNPFSDPVIVPNYFQVEDDLNVLIDAYNFIYKNLSNTKVFKDFGMALDTTPEPECAHEIFGTEPYWICLARNLTQTFHHFSGTCKMGPRSDTSSVVDANLLVRGTKNLRVADASIIPVLGNFNSNAPVIMIGEKAADIIKKALL
ncbi:glucose dehydrogenase [FAD, quinone]-like [Periplaneta americana]|uniref:glucose dehydrogenase [FAD, quinone]-like n=1 Tax=Periplaneta americana TaxID=6978 RepID=UPI0037E755BF